MGPSRAKHFHHHNLMLSFQTRSFSLIISKYDAISSYACIWTIRRMFHLKSWYDRITQARRDIKRFLVELAAQSRGNYGGSCSGPCQILAISKGEGLYSTTSLVPCSLWSPSRFFPNTQSEFWCYHFFVYFSLSFFCAHLRWFLFLLLQTY